MKLPLAAALSFSLILVSASVVIRQRNNVQNKESAEIVTQILEGDSGYDFSNLKPEDNLLKSSSTPPLTTTDLIGHQLILDYVDLATRGQATDENLNKLAENYVDSIPTILSPRTLNYTDLTSVSNTRLNLQTYATDFTKIYKSYSERVKAANANAKNSNVLGPGLYSLASNLSKIYLDTSNQLQKLPVPLALAENHLKIINIYLEDSVAMKAISETEKDASQAFAGMVTINNNMDEESAILNSITDILTKNGI